MKKKKGSGARKASRFYHIIWRLSAVGLDGPADSGEVVAVVAAADDDHHHPII